MEQLSLVLIVRLRSFSITRTCALEWKQRERTIPSEAEECKAFMPASAMGVCGPAVGVVAGSGRMAPLLARDEPAVSSSMPLERLGVVAQHDSPV